MEVIVDTKATDRLIVITLDIKSNFSVFSDIFYKTFKLHHVVLEKNYRK